MDTELAGLSIAEAGALLKAKRLSPVEYVEGLLDRIESFDNRLDSFVEVASAIALDEARAAADEIQRGNWRGPLHGIPYGLKDMIDYAGVPTTANSKILAGHDAVSDAEVTRRLKDAGAIFMGKLTCHEFADGGPSFDLPWGPARNPWNRELQAGGSSTGSGAAVSAGFVPGALGTDTGGSIRNPAAQCGIVGLKPTSGRVSSSGVLPMAPSFDQVGPMTRTVRDNALMLQVLAGYDSADSYSVDVEPSDYLDELESGVGGLRIGYIRQFHTEDFMDADPEMVASIDLAVETLRAEGAEIREVVLHSLAEYSDVWNTMMLRESYAVHRRWLEERPEDYGRMAHRRFSSGATVTESDYDAAVARRRDLMRQFAEATDGLDALICAVNMDTSSAITDADACARTRVREARRVFSLLGNPALAVPTGFSSSGMPLSMQVVGRAFDEAMILRVGYAYEQAFTWYERTPALE